MISCKCIDGKLDFADASFKVTDGDAVVQSSTKALIPLNLKQPVPENGLVRLETTYKALSGQKLTHLENTFQCTVSVKEAETYQDWYSDSYGYAYLNNWYTHNLSVTVPNTDQVKAVASRAHLNPTVRHCESQYAQICVEIELTTNKNTAKDAQELALRLESVYYPADAPFKVFRLQLIGKDGLVLDSVKPEPGASAVFSKPQELLQKLQRVRILAHWETAYYESLELHQRQMSGHLSIEELQFRVSQHLGTIDLLDYTAKRLVLGEP